MSNLLRLRRNLDSLLLPPNRLFLHLKPSHPLRRTILRRLQSPLRRIPRGILRNHVVPNAILDISYMGGE